MKKLFFSLFTIGGITINAQQVDYASMMENPSSNFSQIQEAFRLNWQNKDRHVKGKGYKAFKRWEYFHEKRLTQQGELVNSNALNFFEYKNYFGINKNQSSLRISGPTSNVAGSWSYIGPPNGVSSSGGAGRATFIR